MAGKYFISCLDYDRKLERFRVPKDVYTYIKQLESAIKYPEVSKLTTVYSDRFLSRNEQDTQVPEGYVLVPVEPTEEMISWGTTGYLDPTAPTAEDHVNHIYKMMLHGAQESE